MLFTCCGYLMTFGRFLCRVFFSKRSLFIGHTLSLLLPLSIVFDQIPMLLTTPWIISSISWHLNVSHLLFSPFLYIFVVFCLLSMSCRFFPHFYFSFANLCLNFIVYSCFFNLTTDLCCFHCVFYIFNFQNHNFIFFFWFFYHFLTIFLLLSTIYYLLLVCCILLVVPRFLDTFLFYLLFCFLFFNFFILFSPFFNFSKLIFNHSRLLCWSLFLFLVFTFYLFSCSSLSFRFCVV